jgi:hypothetical protein
MKRLIGATALAILGLSYSAQAAVEPDPVEEPVAAVEPEIVVWTGDVKDHIDYGAVVVWTGDVKDHIGYGQIVVWTGESKDHTGYGEVVETPSAPVRPCVSGFVNRVPC